VATVEIGIVPGTQAGIDAAIGHLYRVEVTEKLAIQEIMHGPTHDEAPGNSAGRHDLAISRRRRAASAVDLF